jgi:hypothetical protein
MYFVKIIKNGVQTHGAEFPTEQEALDWLNQVKNKPSKPFGKVAGIYPISKLSQEEIATAIQSIPADEVNGIEEMAEIPDQFSVEVGLKVKSQAEINAEARKYLADTDWHIVKHVETGYQVPQNILEARADARASIVE